MEVIAKLKLGYRFFGPPGTFVDSIIMITLREYHIITVENFWRADKFSPGGLLSLKRAFVRVEPSS